MAEKRFIDANGSYTLVATDNTGYGLCFGGGIISVINWHGSVVAEFYADDAPAADVVEVRHGYWYFTEYEYFDCSECGESYLNGCDCTYEAKEKLRTGDLYKYCPKCGAKMDGGVNHGDA